MKSETSKTTTGSSRETLTPTDIFPLLADERRRHVLYYLEHRVGAVAIGDVAEQVALAEDDLSRDRFERIVTGLYHVHLPKLQEAGIVRYDLERETIERRPTADQLTPYLDVAIVQDRR